MEISTNLIINSSKERKIHKTEICRTISEQFTYNNRYRSTHKECEGIMGHGFFFFPLGKQQSQK